MIDFVLSVSFLYEKRASSWIALFTQTLQILKHSVEISEIEVVYNYSSCTSALAVAEQFVAVCIEAYVDSVSYTHLTLPTIA